MIDEKEKTALGTSVGADAGQSIQSQTTQIIAGETPEINDLEDISQEKFFLQMQRMQDPAYLHTVSMNELYETVYEGKQAVIDGLLYAGTYLFAGAPKVGKSFFMAQLAYHVSTGQKLWKYEVHQGTVLYLALEDDYQRLQERMSRMFGVEGTDKLRFAICAKHLGKMKQFADRNRICLLLVHHTRKQQAGDKFEMISGTTGLLGCADGAFLLQKEKRTDQNATLDIVGRDQPDQRLHLTRNMEKLSWDLDHAETELWKKPPDPFLKKVAGILTVAAPEWNGSATELAALLQEEMQPNILTRQLNVKAGELLSEYGVEYTVKRTRNGSAIRLRNQEV